MLNRRSFLKTTLAAGAMLPFLSIPRALAAELTLRIMYWGSPDRVRRSDALSALFEKTFPGLKINAEAAADYNAKINIMLAGNNLPDIFQLEPMTLPDYARRGAVIPLDDLFAKNLIRTDNFEKSVLTLGQVDGKNMGIAQAINSYALIYDKDAYAKAGISEPKQGLTWEEYARQAIELRKASGNDRFWGAPYGARTYYVLQAWLMQRGKLMYTEDQKLGFDIGDAVDFYTYWENLRKAGGCTPADISSKSLLSPDSSEMSTKNSATALMTSNHLFAFSVMRPDLRLGISGFPMIKSDGPSGLFYRPALTWSISRDCKNVEAAASYIDFFINDVGAGKILEAERGIPPNLKVRESVAPQLSEYARMSIDFTNAIAGIVQPYPPTAPLGAGEFDTGVMRPLGDQLAFGKISVKQAAEKLISGGKRAIRQTS